MQRPILTDPEIEHLVMSEYPVWPGEKKCAFEKRIMNELRQRKRNQLFKQNQENLAYNRRIQERSGVQTGREGQE